MNTRAVTRGRLRGMVNEVLCGGSTAMMTTRSDASASATTSRPAIAPGPKGDPGEVEEWVALMQSPSTPIIITIDGPAGTGKSTVARALAERLKLDVLDTGAMYRAAAAITIDHGLSLDEPDEIVKVLMDADLHFDWNRDPPEMLAWLKPMNDRLRRPDVTALVSQIARIGALRAHLVRKQRIIASQHPRLVTEGRDQGSVVFPQASVKFYLDADASERARRRTDQLREQGEIVEVEEVLQRLTSRDFIDSTRDDGPLVCPDDAIIVDTTSMEFDEVVDTLERLTISRLRNLRDDGDAEG